MNKQLHQILNRLLNFGAGFVLLLIGSLTMSLSTHLGLEYPTYITIGAIEVGIGAAIYLLDTFIRVFIKVKEIKGEIKETKDNEKDKLKKDN